MDFRKAYLSRSCGSAAVFRFLDWGTVTVGEAWEGWVRGYGCVGGTPGEDGGGLGMGLACGLGMVLGWGKDVSSWDRGETIISRCQRVGILTCASAIMGLEGE